MGTLRAILRIARIEGSFLAFLAVFLPIYASTGHMAGSVERGIPILFICICAFIANDLDDLEKDRINHPERPLPRGYLSPTFATVLYFVSLGIALLSTSSYVERRTAWVYYLFTIIMISYRFIVEYLPTTKAFYIAVAVVIPVLVIAPVYPDRLRLYTVAGAAFFHVLGREICMNILDRLGDPHSFFHRFTEKSQATVAFASMGVGVILLTIQVKTPGDGFAVALFTILLAIAGFYWFRRSEHKRAVSITKIQMLVGLYFLI
jgi:geranylgeranylglycerol-phosphate geranylgeranyltransferase